MSMSRAEALKQIVTVGDNKEQAYRDLLTYPHHSDTVYLEVTVTVLVDVLTMYLDDKFSADELEMWAEFIESRDDIDGSDVEDYLYALANPLLLAEINKPYIQKMLALLSAQ
ncbi:hypothetical protein [Thalassotalea maritima]|uniref:hypothetical protein n=1 Tax=Thalassotalea maritima TaxID=3242416 RepID=UPI0035299347